MAHFEPSPPTPRSRRLSPLASISLVACLWLCTPSVVAAPSPAPRPSPRADSHLTIEQEIQLGRQVAPAVRRLNGGAWENPQALQRIRTMGMRLVAVSDRKDVALLRNNFSFELLATKNVNAMAVPGGITFVTRGLVELGLSEDEMACVLAHEIAHAARRHGAINMETDTSMKARIAAQHKGRAMRLLGRLYTMAYLRKRLDPGLELEADYYAMVYASRAGYNPRGLVSLFERFERMEKKGKGRLSQKILVLLFDNHPPTPERLRKAKELATRLERKEPVHTVPVPVYR